jgi:alpha-aminoadipate carrier protein LysW
MVVCPLCDSELELNEDDLDEGDDITCEECGADLRVVGIDPLELELVEEEEEDEDLDYEDEEEDEDGHWR